MNIELYFTIPELRGVPTQGASSMVVDVIRATSTIVEALSSGARAIYPVESVEEAFERAESMGRKDTLVCGERGGLPIEGFDLGNSPREFTPDAVSGRNIVMTTTNGTRALLAVEDSASVATASFLNLGAAAAAVSAAERVIIVCAGRDDRFSFDDALCGGQLVRRILSTRRTQTVLNDSAAAALALAGSVSLSAEFLREVAAGRALVGVGLAEDLDLCAQTDRHDLVPTLVDGAVRLLA